jgi:4-aminobutyrate aminotransferase-like enzyme
MQSLDTPSGEICASLTRRTIRNGVLAIRANNQQESLLIMPPLVITEPDVDEIVGAIAVAAAEVAGAQ